MGDERAGGGKVADLALHQGTDRIFTGDNFPRVLFHLAHAEGNLLLFGIHAQNHGIHLIPERQHVGGTLDALGP